MNKSDICLIITGTIEPPAGVFKLSLSDKNVRRKQYIDSIKYYIQKTKIEKIIFCDNSDALEEIELKMLALKYNKEFEWISFKGDNSSVVKQGKGFGEGEIIKYIFENSMIIKKCRMFVKVTGRLIVKNIDTVINFTTNDFFYCDFQQNIVYTHFYVMPIDMYKLYFMNAYNYVNDRDGHFLEHCFYNVRINNSIQTKQFIIYPNITGISGSTGERYDISVLKRIMRSIKGLLYNYCNIDIGKK